MFSESFLYVIQLFNYFCISVLMLLVLYVEKLDGGGGKKEGKARSVVLLELHIFDG